MEKQMTTKEKIIFESLKLFSEKGYEGVSMREIASAVGIKGASIYNHFKGKEEIFNAIFEEMKSRYDGFATSMHIPVEQDDTTTEIYLNIDEEMLLKYTENLLGFLVKEEFPVMFRKLLVGEQHRSPIAAEMLKQYYFDGPILFQKQLFESLQKKGVFKGYDAGIMALHFYSPIYYIICKLDLGASYEEYLQTIKSHVHGFYMLYVK
ncbi:hypothetical protein CS063_13230 [Sporanaerobium hydrogeniformans]|uniref:Uncharacterized protein n=1 Tax=Sporanaerobium hydrogeniformans TaxID=3072179 RepID=A0AC61DAY4_9FIRM|nr:TetR/AcrR family transcriptional regulator [Sporanaerobium hydrogeniformans]PHV69940.1 hypothetical protein CS063_13230 [Sporanaerobium hydrogeniformans]